MDETFPNSPVLLIAMHYASDLHVRHLNFVESVSFGELYEHRSQVTACYPIQSHLSMRVECAMDYELVCFYVYCADRRVMGNLLEVYRNTSDGALESFTEDRVEWLLETDMQWPDAHHKQRHKLSLLNKILSLTSGH